MKASRRILTFLASLLAVGLIASAGLAVTRPLVSSGGREVATSGSDARTTCNDEGSPADNAEHPADDTEHPADDTEGCSEDEGTSEEGDADPGEGEPSPPEDDGSVVEVPDGEAPGADVPAEGDESGAVDPIRETACSEAAGVTPAPEHERRDTTDPAAEASHGLSNAIDHVLANCRANPTAPGLLVALRHLVANEGKHDGSEDAKADARDEAKVGRAPHGRGGPAIQETAPGNSGVHGNGGGAPGPRVSHGNGNGGGPQGNPHGD